MPPKKSKKPQEPKPIRTLADLVPDPMNARKHNERNIGMLERSLEEVGAARSIVVDETGNILAGHGVVEAAANVGIEKVRTVEADGNEIIAVVRRGLTDAQKQRLALYDNRVAELSEWSPEALKALAAEDGALKGLFSENELAAIIGKQETEEGPEPQLDKAGELQKKWGTKRGQIWEIGNHRLMCGDSANADAAKLAPSKVNGVFTSPPYAEQRKDQYGGIASNLYSDW